MEIQVGDRLIEVSFGTDETSFSYPLDGKRLKESTADLCWHTDLVGIHMRPKRFRLGDVDPNLVVSYETGPRRSEYGFPEALWYKYQDIQFAGALHVIHDRPADLEPVRANSALLISPIAGAEVKDYLEFCEKGGQLCIDTDIMYTSAQRGYWKFTTYDMLTSELPEGSIVSVHLSLVYRDTLDFGSSNEPACSLLRSVITNKKVVDKPLIILRLRPATRSATLISQFLSYVKMDGVGRVVQKDVT